MYALQHYKSYIAENDFVQSSLMGKLKRLVMTNYTEKMNQQIDTDFR